MKKSLVMALSIVLCAALAIGSTMAYLSDTDSDVNVMTLGSVKIKQHEKDREGKDFVDQPIYPAVYEGEVLELNTEGWYDNAGVLDKIVTVENTGKSEAYVRTIFAFEKDINDVIVLNQGTEGWNWKKTDVEVELETGTYSIYVATLDGALANGATTKPSLKQLYMKNSADNEDIENFGEAYEIIAVSQAVQTAGFAEVMDADGNVVKTAAEVALDAGFGTVNKENCLLWLKGMAPVLNAEALQAALKNATEGTTILLGADITTDLVMPGNVKSITIDGNGHKLNGAITLNGAENTTLKNITFNAEHAELAYDGKGNKRFNTLIMTGDAANTPGRGAIGLTIDNCTFEGTYANGGTTIGFNDQGCGTGPSGNITIKNCTFNTEGGYVDIYTYYSGNGSFVIENNTFSSTTVDRPIYLGRYQSSTPVVLKDNTFTKVANQEAATYIQAHSAAYTVSFEAENNTYAVVNP